MMFSPNKAIGSIVYRTREVLNNNTSFKEALRGYLYSPNCLVNDTFSLWHYPGTQNEISTALLKIGEHFNGSKLKFPALLNFQTIRQDKSGNEIKLHYNLAIAGVVKSTWATEDREVELFDLLLRPIYEEFIKQIKQCGWFNVDYGVPPHSYYEVFTTGNNYSELQNVYGDYIDAIELHDLQLTVKQNLCDRDLKKISNENMLVTSNINQILNS